MEELKDITNVIGNLFRARAFTLMSDQPSKESTAKALEGSIRRSLDTGDGLQYGLVEANDAAQGIMSVADSESLVNYLSLRRDVLNLLTPVAPPPEDDKAEETAESGGGDSSPKHFFGTDTATDTGDYVVCG